MLRRLDSEVDSFKKEKLFSLSIYKFNPQRLIFH